LPEPKDLTPKGDAAPVDFLRNTGYITPDVVNEPLYVITTLFNPIRFKSRWKHYQRFAQYVQDSGGVLYTVEASFGEREEAVAEYAPHKTIDPRRAWTDCPSRYTRVRTSSELWVKENLINIGISRLPPDWKYVAWIDADVMFARPNWVGETIQQLQHYKVLQMFSEVADLGPRYATIQRHRGFAWCYHHGIPPQQQMPGGYYYQPLPDVEQPTHIMWHPGFAWAARREAIEDLGGLMDFAILGAADNHMANSLIGNGAHSVHAKIHPVYRARVLSWQEKADRHIRRNLGYVSGLLVHYWHGRKVDRRYWDRWKILTELQYNPDTDIQFDWNGVLKLTDRGDHRSIQLRDRIMQYFRQRNEDSIDLEGISDAG
jgi:hypothetical protein